MAVQESNQAAGSGGQALKRRGLIAGAAALVAGALARQSAQTVEAAYNLMGDVTNGASDTTVITGSLVDRAILSLTNTNTAQGYPDGLHITSSGGIGAFITAAVNTGVYSIGGNNGVIGIASSVLGAAIAGQQLGAGTGDGIRGFAGNGNFARGVYGTSLSTTGAGVTGDSPYAGVNGSGKHYGVLGSSDGVNGIAINAYASNPGGMGVYADSVGIYGIYGTSEASGGVGVAGNCNAGYGLLGTVLDGAGVLGQANTGIGVSGSSVHKHGVSGTTTGALFGGVYGQTATPNAVGVYGSTFNGTTNVATAFAGYMDGNFAVVHGTKSAGVPHPDGSYRLVYCMESPENWFEDFGEGKLVGGKAEVTLDPDFAAIVHADAYHVFLTPRGDSKGVYVSAQTAAGFSVREQQGGASSLGFSWRVVAKRKDITPERLAKFALPSSQKTQGTHLASLAALPKPPQPPKPPAFPAVSPETAFAGLPKKP